MTPTLQEEIPYPPVLVIKLIDVVLDIKLALWIDVPVITLIHKIDDLGIF